MWAKELTRKREIRSLNEILLFSQLHERRACAAVKRDYNLDESERALILVTGQVRARRRPTMCGGRQMLLAHQRAHSEGCAASARH